ncbi:MAG: hypothetical protein K9L68_11355 [Spirochaetales bacterium]|nr:hypothetical protein [Spirochaetales bacterium]MCF7939184.1 hypothetical protein [Spirochaetales bacterium]
MSRKHSRSNLCCAAAGRPVFKQMGSVLLLPVTVVLLLTAFPADARAEEHQITVETEINWEKRVVTATASIALEGFGRNKILPALRLAAERELEQRKGEVFREILNNIPVDSATRIGELIRANPALGTQIDRLDERIPPIRSSFSQDQHYLRRNFTIPFEELVALVSEADTPLSIPQRTAFYPSGKYSGLVIYAAGALPVQGRPSQTAELAPCLIPTLYDEQMRPLVNGEMIDFNRLAEEGLLHYRKISSEDTIEKLINESLAIIGPEPLYTIAVGLYGNNPSDIILSMDTANQLRYRQRNRRILENSRVLVLY